MQDNEEDGKKRTSIKDKSGLNGFFDNLEEHLNVSRKCFETKTFINYKKKAIRSKCCNLIFKRTKKEEMCGKWNRIIELKKRKKAEAIKRPEIIIVTPPTSETNENSSKRDFKAHDFETVFTTMKTEKMLCKNIKLCNWF